MLTAALRVRFSQGRSDQTPPLEAVEGRVDRAWGHDPPGAALDFGANRHAVGVLAEPDQREQQELFERAEPVVSGWHTYSVGNIDEETPDKVAG